jgi:tetratricopeptide (TPR) repeat protein
MIESSSAPNHHAPCPCGSGKEYAGCCLGKNAAAARQCCNLGNTLLGQGKADAAIGHYRRALLLQPDFAEAHCGMGYAKQLQGELDAAIECYRRAISSNPDFAGAYSNLGLALQAQGNLAAAIENFRRAIALQPDFADAHFNLGIALRQHGNPHEAEASYRRALQIGANDFEAHHNLGNTLLELGRADEACQSYRQALLLQPGYADAHLGLGNALMELQRPAEAEACYRQALKLRPHHAAAHARLGSALFILGRLPDAEANLRQAIELEGAEQAFFTLFTLGNVLKAAGRVDESRAAFRRAQQIQLLNTWPSCKKPADFSVLLLDSPDVLCTPADYIVGGANYDTHALALLPDTDYDIATLRAKADVVFNMISDADNGLPVLPRAEALADRIGRPTVNHPRKIRGTDRATVAARLSGIPLCRIPKTARLSAQELAQSGWRERLQGYTRPLLIRSAGVHGGGDIEKIDDLDGVAPFASRHPDDDFYLSEFVDYRSNDGYFRKYRMVFVNGEILPYHLAIHDRWLVHHFRTDMALHAWMRKEEEAFLEDPHSVFDAAQHAALGEVARAIGLDYGGIDCAFDRAGNIVVFEANATMRIHDEKHPTFAYKNPHIAKIKTAFDAMLARMAAGG